MNKINDSSWNEEIIRKRRRKTLEDIFMGAAVAFAEMSTCARVKVGGVLVKNNRIVSTGYNGSPSGVIHCTDFFLGRDVEKEEHAEFSRKYELHCEQNIIIECLKNQIQTDGSILYVTTSPCSSCAKMLVAAKIKKVFYNEIYDREIDGIDLLNQCGITCQQYKWSEN